MIQQVITCDMCGAQKREANHWFIAREESGELCINGWNSPHTLSPGTRHLCGETCVHKLISQDLVRLADCATQSIDEAAPAAGIAANARPTGVPPAPSMRQVSRIAPGSTEYPRCERSYPCTGRKTS